MEVVNRSILVLRLWFDPESILKKDKKLIELRICHIYNLLIQGIAQFNVFSTVRIIYKQFSHIAKVGHKLVINRTFVNHSKRGPEPQNGSSASAVSILLALCNQPTCFCKPQQTL